MIQHIGLIAEWNARCLQPAERTNDVTRFHIASRVIIPANRQDARMAAARPHDEIVEIHEIFVVVRDQDQRMVDGIQEMSWVRAARGADLSRNDKGVPRFAKNAG